MCKNKCAVCAMYSVHIAYIAHRAYILYIRVAKYAFLFTLAGPTHFARISKITTRRYETSTCVNVVNSDNVGMSTVVHFKHYIFNILSSDYRGVLKLYQKFEKSCIMLWYNFRNN